MYGLKSSDLQHFKICHQDTIVKWGLVLPTKKIKQEKIICHLSIISNIMYLIDIMAKFQYIFFCNNPLMY